MDIVLVLLIGVLVRLVIPLALLLLISSLIGRRNFRLS
jgi:hypothetical protein